MVVKFRLVPLANRQGQRLGFSKRNPIFRPVKRLSFWLFPHQYISYIYYKLLII